MQHCRYKMANLHRKVALETLNHAAGLYQCPSSKGARERDTGVFLDPVIWECVLCACVYVCMSNVFGG